MKISHRQNVVRPMVSRFSAKVTRLGCCCRLSELLPMVRQMHDDAARAKAVAGTGQEEQQAA